MKIILTSYYYKPHFGGIENSLYHLAKEYQGQGHEVLIITSDVAVDKKSRLMQDETLDGIQIKRFKSFKPAFSLFVAAAPFVDVQRCKSAFMELGFIPDIVITRHYITGIAALKAGLKYVLYLVPGIVKFQDGGFIKITTSDSILQVIKKIYQKCLIIPRYEKQQVELLKNAARVFVFSKNMFQQVLRVAPGISKNILITKPGVDITRFNTFNKNEARKKIGISNEVFVFLVLCRLAKQKSVEVAIEAFKKMPPQKETILLIVGEGPEKGNLLEQVISYGLKEKVIFIDQTTTPEIYYSAADVFLLPSVHEPFGQTLVEALFSGLPVIAFDSGEKGIETASSEIIEHNKTGLLCQFKIDDFANAMKRMVNNPLAIEDYLPAIKQNYSWKKLSEDLLKP